ncbi:MAG: cell wall-binding repeat-containing protein [Microbacterium sp.]
MAPPAVQRPKLPGIPRIAASLIAVAALVVGVLLPVQAASASVAAVGGPVKATLDGFTPGNIISDAVFTSKDTMTEAQIQSFFNGKVSSCQSGYTCLKDFRITSVNRSADEYCKGYTGAANESAARIIYRVSQSCNINPQVLIVMLQKEQGLVTHTWPSSWRYDIALGQGCPDDAACDPDYVGFFHQIYGAARQMQIYMEGRYFTWYAPGRTWNILYNPDTSCGSAPVYVANKATAALYYYTPYQPNAAALRAGYGSGDYCSAYGNRNFYNYFTDWFGSTQTAPLATFGSMRVTVEGSPVVGRSVRAQTEFSPAPTTLRYQWFRGSTAISGATSQDYAILAADAGQSLSVSVTAQRAGYKDGVQQSAAVAVQRNTTVDRLYGQTREQTSVAVSRAAWPSGTRTVFLATSLDFADAISSAAIGSRMDASLLLTPPGYIPDSVSAELQRLAPTRIVLMGGEGVLTPNVGTQANALVPTAKIERLSGANRYATSRAVLESAGQSVNVFVATGRDFPDALSAAAAGSAMSAPVLLVDGQAQAVEAESIASLRKVGATTITIVGGTGVVSTSIENQLRQQGFTVSRLEGRDRYATNAAVNNAYFAGTALKALVAAGTDFPDALSASVLAGRWQVPLLLSEQTCIPSPGSDFLRSRGTESVTLVGGPGVLSEDGVAALRPCG